MERKPEKVFLEIMLNGAVVAKKQVKVSENMFLSIMMRAKGK